MRTVAFIALKTIADRWEDWETVDGSDTDNEIYNGGGANG